MKVADKLSDFKGGLKCLPALFVFIACDERHRHAYYGGKRPEFMLFDKNTPPHNRLANANFITKSKNHPGDFLILLYIFNEVLSIKISTKKQKRSVYSSVFALVIARCLFYPKVISRIIITVNPRANITTPILECSPSDISGISSSTTT